MNNPREFSEHLTTMVCSHNKYNLGDEKPQNTDLYTSWDEWFLNEVIEDNPKHEIVYLPLYLYDHSGITMNTTGFHCPWDSGQVGFIYARVDDLMNNTHAISDEELKQILINDVQEYDDYLTGRLEEY